MIGRFFGILLLAGGLASATQIVENPDGTRGENISFNDYGANGGTVTNQFAGVLGLTLTETSGGVLTNYNRDTLCVDLYTDIYNSSAYATTVLTPNSLVLAAEGRNTARLERVAWLVDTFLYPTNSGVPVTNPDWVVSQDQGAGMQLAIWDIMVDGGDGLETGEGNVQVSSNSDNPTSLAVLGWANFYETASQGKSSNLAFVYDNVSIGNNTAAGTPAQMLEGPVFLDNGPTPYPEPATFGLMGAALIGIGRLARRRSA